MLIFDIVEKFVRRFYLVFELSYLLLKHDLWSNMILYSLVSRALMQRLLSLLQRQRRHIVWVESTF